MVLVFIVLRFTLSYRIYISKVLTETMNKFVYQKYKNLPYCICFCSFICNSQKCRSLITTVITGTKKNTTNLYLDKFLKLWRYVCWTKLFQSWIDCIILVLTLAVDIYHILSQRGNMLFGFVTSIKLLQHLKYTLMLMSL